MANMYIPREMRNQEFRIFMWDIPVCGEYKLVQLIHVPNFGSYTRSRIVQLTVLHSLSYLYRICKPDDGSHEPKHVAPCSPLFLINNSILYFVVCD